MKGYAIKYTEEQLLFVKNNCTLMRKELTLAFNKKFNSSHSQNNLAALCKRNGWLTGRTGCYVKGEIPWNNGKKGYMGANKTSFKKGSRPHNWKPVGSTRICKDGYLEVKIADPKTWRQQHVLTWENENGKTPDGFCIIFADGDKTNIAPSNLQLISRNENLQRNKLGINNAPQTLKPYISALAKLEVLRYQKTKGNRV